MTALTRRRLDAGQPYPLGATWDGSGVNFAVFSAHADKIELCLFDPSGKRELERLSLPECTDQVWHGYLPNAKLGQLYGYRAHGPYEPQRGHRFNPAKLLLDPYAKATAGEIDWDQALFSYDFGDPDSRNDDDSAPHMTYGVVINPFFDWASDRAPGTPYQDLIELGQSQLGGPILNVSLCGGFALADCARCGFAVTVTVTLLDQEESK